MSTKHHHREPYVPYINLALVLVVYLLVLVCNALPRACALIRVFWLVFSIG